MAAQCIMHLLCWWKGSKIQIVFTSKHQGFYLFFMCANLQQFHVSDVVFLAIFQEVCAMKFNVLVTTYEFIMYDRSKLSKVDWKYIIIDEAQRMKDRESVLARDLDRYRCQRRLLLTGTPLQVCQKMLGVSQRSILCLIL